MNAGNLTQPLPDDARFEGQDVALVRWNDGPDSILPVLREHSLSRRMDSNPVDQYCSR
jgi:hypothetical protein